LILTFPSDNKIKSRHNFQAVKQLSAFNLIANRDILKNYSHTIKVTMKNYILATKDAKNLKFDYETWLCISQAQIQLVKKRA